MPVDVLRCRVCESDYPAEANGICARCFGPLEPVYDWDEIARVVSRESIEAGPRSLWRYSALLPAEPPEDAASGPGLHAARPGAAARVGDRRRRGAAEARPREPDALVQGPRRRDRGGEGARVRPRDALGHVDRQPRERGRRARGRDRHARGHLLPGRARAREARGDDGLRRHGLRRPRLATTTARASSSEFAGEVEWGIVNVNLRSYYAEGSKTLAFEICEQLGWETPDAVVMPIGSGAMFTKVWLGFQQFERLGLIAGAQPKLYGGQAEGCAPVASAFAENRRVTPVRPNSLASSIAIGNPADGDLTIEKARASGGGDLLRARGRDRREHLAARRDGRHLRRGRDRRRDRRAPRGRRAAASSARATASSSSSPAPA